MYIKNPKVKQEKEKLSKVRGSKGKPLKERIEAIEEYLGI